MKYHQDHSDEPFQHTTDSNLSDDRTAIIKQVSSYRSEPIRWLEEGRIALGKLTLIAGDPGLGKSFITLDMAARVSRGELPKYVDPSDPSQEGSEREPVNNAKPYAGRLVDCGQVALLNAEDDAGDTIRPRLETMGADLSRINIVEGIVQPMGKVCNLTQLDTDIQLLAHALKKIENLKLVVIDPISAYMGKTDSHNNADVRAVLAELSRLAAWTGAAVVCVTHLNKDTGGKKAVYRAMGSLAFTAAARTVHLVTKHPEDSSKRIVAPVKNNLGVEMKPRVYLIEDGAVQWLDEEVEWDADSLDTATPQSPSALEEAKGFLIEALKDGERASAEVLADAEAQRIAATTLQRARQALGVRSIRNGANWIWSIEQPEHPLPDEPAHAEIQGTQGEIYESGFVQE